MKVKLYCKLLSAKILTLMSFAAYGFQPFTVQDIRLEGLQRISIGTVFNYLPVKVGDEVNDTLTSEAIHALYETGFFKDVRIERDDNVLVVFVAERPAIAKINLEGNSALPSEALTASFKQIGLTEGKVFDRSLLDTIVLELKRQYFSIGLYAVNIETIITPLERNRVDVDINIAEGDTAVINLFNIVGNHEFDNDKLRGMLELGEAGFFGRNDYSKQLFAADLETLKSYYQDRGFINFNINSTQVSLTPDKEDVYISVNVSEGDKYTISGIELSGKFIVPKSELEALVAVEAGELFSRKQVSKSRTNITDKLAELGYAFANVNVTPTINEKDKSVALTFYVDPGRRIYVRRINVGGNIKTKDEVIRREVRQMEGDWLSSKKVALSRARLNRLGFFDEVSIETPLVPGTKDQVDVLINVKERATGSLTAGVGFSDAQGLILNFALNQNNFAGTGKSVGINISNSDLVENYNLSLNDPYYTLDGVSQGMSVFRRKVDTTDSTISNFSTNTYGARLGYGMPLSEEKRLSANITYENTEIIEGTNTSQDIKDFIAIKGSVYDVVKLTTLWSYDTRNKKVFADEGVRLTFGFDLAVPGSDLEFYKLSARYRQYFPFAEQTTLLLRANVGYGDSYGDTHVLPPFENYYAGGSRSVRGYDANSLGPRDPVTNDVIGGNKMLTSGVELILPNIFDENNKNVRTSVFFDAGNVFGEGQSFDVGELRTSTGIALIWITPVGIMRFSLAEPLNDEPGDETKSFQFTLGSTF